MGIMEASDAVIVALGGIKSAGNQRAAYERNLDDFVTFHGGR